jgi:hypothetical protein
MTGSGTGDKKTSGRKVGPGNGEADAKSWMGMIRSAGAKWATKVATKVGAI